MKILFATFSLFALLECVFKGYEWPREPYWILRGIGYLLFVAFLGQVITPWMYTLLHPFAIFDLSFLGLWGVLPAILLYELLVYFFHRALHEIPFLWRIHQTHHSAERIDIWSAYHVHPLELVIFTFAGLMISEGFLGVTADAAFIVSLLIVVVQTFEHTNVKTPKWLGYIIARPENHMLHHARDGHRANYSDLPIVDMIFGTFELPDTAPAAVGFWDGASREMGALLMCRDVEKDIGSAS